MKPIVRNVLIGTAATVVVLGVAAAIKAAKAKAIFDLMDIEPYAIDKIKPDWGNLKVSFNLDVLLRNNSDDDLFVSGASVASLKKIKIFYKNIYLATADVNINTVKIDGKDTLIISNIPVEVSGVNALQILPDLLSFDIKNMGIIGSIQALGNTYEIGGE